MSFPKELKGYAASLGFAQSETLARIFEILYDEEDDLKIMDALKRPKTLPKLAKKTGLSEAKVKEVVDRLIKKGALVHTAREPIRYKRFPIIIELRDASCIIDDAPQELFELWDKLVQNEISTLIPFIKQLKIPAVMRVVPIEETVEVQNTVLDPDSIRKLFKDAKVISSLKCPCRTVAKKNDRGHDCPAPEGIGCMQTNRYAQIYIDRGIGKQITNEEALKRVELAEKAGLVHMIRNNIKEDMLVCYCCPCCCSGLFMIKEGYTEAIAPSRFKATVNEEACVGCGRCVDSCLFGAITVTDVASIDKEKCYGCGNCSAICPEKALKLVEIYPLEHIRVT